MSVAEFWVRTYILKNQARMYRLFRRCRVEMKSPDDSRQGTVMASIFTVDNMILMRSTRNPARYSTMHTRPRRWACRVVHRDRRVIHRDRRMSREVSLEMSPRCLRPMRLRHRLCIHETMYQRMRRPDRQTIMISMSHGQKVHRRHHLPHTHHDQSISRRRGRIRPGRDHQDHSSRARLS